MLELSEMSAPVTNQNMMMIPLSEISLGNNPRKHFDQVEMNELVSSVRANGILQPILVRMNDDGGYAIVAGERRYRAALTVYGEDSGSIPAVVRTMTDLEANTASLTENTARQNMTATEESVAAKVILERHDGNKEETCAVLGWSIAKLVRRLALLNLTEAVMDALNTREILLGHAELLCAIPAAKQDRALSNIIGKNLTVTQVKDMLAKSATLLAGAIFDTASCAACQHNSTQQATLFSVSVEEGRCTNSDCFKANTTDRIAEIKLETEETFPNVRVIEVGDPTSGFDELSADGGLGVGADQFIACKGCGNFGAVISMIPGEVGQVTANVCFDLGCRQKKVTDRMKAEKAALEEVIEDDGEELADDEDGSPVVKKAAPVKIVKPKAEKKATTSTLSSTIKDYRRKSVWNVAAENELRLQTGKATSFLIDLLLAGYGSKVSSGKLTALVAEQMGAESEVRHSSCKINPAIPHALSPENKKQIFVEAAVSAVSNVDESHVKTLLSFLDADLGNHWSITADFLTLLTKSEIESVCTDLGLPETMPDFKKAIGGKKGDAIKAIMACGFDFTGKIPTMLAYVTPEP